MGLESAATASTSYRAVSDMAGDSGAGMSRESDIELSGEELNGSSGGSISESIVSIGDSDEGRSSGAGIRSSGTGVSGVLAGGSGVLGEPGSTGSSGIKIGEMIAISVEVESFVSKPGGSELVTDASNVVVGVSILETEGSRREKNVIGAEVESSGEASLGRGTGMAAGASDSGSITETEGSSRETGASGKETEGEERGSSAGP